MEKHKIQIIKYFCIMVEGWNETEWTKEMEAKSLDEIREEINTTKQYLSFLRDLQEVKEAAEFPYGAHYIKVYGCNGDGPEYINCEYCTLDRSSLHSEPHIYFKGVGFSSEFGPYDDSNYVSFSTYDDHYLCYRFWQDAERARSEGRVKPGDHEWNHYRIEIIDLSEYEEAFNQMVEKMKETFLKWKTPYGKEN